MNKALSGILALSLTLSVCHLAKGQTAAPGSLDDQLVTAAKEGDTAAVQQLLAQGANIETKSDNATPLTAAASSGDAYLVKLLLARGANIEGADTDGHRALDVAADAGQFDIVKLLLEMDANIEAATQTAIGR